MSSFARFLAFGAGPGDGGANAKPARDARIDVIRGLALLVIFINHMPGNVLAQWMPHNFGFSDAADAFVLLAGISATLAYGTLIERRGFRHGILKLGARLWTLYIAHIAVFLIVCGVVATAVTQTQNPLYIEAINIQPFFNDTLSALVDALALVYQPYYLDILPLYIVLLASFPLIYLGARLSPALTLIASIALWQGAVHLGVNLPNTGAGGWFFNPFAWQLVFTIGVLIGRAGQLGIAAPRLRLVDTAAIGFLLFSLIVKTSSGNPFGIAALDDWIDTIQLGTDKTNLAWVRVLHVLALAWLVIRFVPAGSAIARSIVGRHLAVIGRHSLEVFCAGVVLSITGQIVLAETGFALGVQLLVCLAGVIMLAGLGIFLSWHQSVRHRSAPGASSPASASALAQS
ncbi:OpgC family protein [Bosea sp. PAMC 26642]|uniref:OpgC family protein n=1 Tax=Bosea sp. (strain PAMC 26642) TaxID=1792307 RepID=UPI001F2490B5|nr:OpgC domain-containing protein [Bosea sp. PAMC 26642]